MIVSQVAKKVCFAAMTAGLLILSGCSNQEQATNPTPPAKPASKAAPAKPQTAAKPQPATTAKKAAPASKSASAKPVSASSKVAAGTKLVIVPKGTAISAKIGQALASNKNHAGDSFAATLTSSVKVDGKTVIPKGAQLTGHVISAKKKGPAELTVALVSVEVHGKSYPLATNSVGPATSAQASDSDASKQKKDITLAADSRVKFKLAKSVKIPIKG